MVITNIPKLYQSPYTIEPLENDQNQKGKASDHLIVVTKPLSDVSQIRTRKHKIVKFRQYPDSAIRQFGQWLLSQSWSEIYSENCSQQRAIILEKLLLEKIDEYFPEKQMKVNSNDKPWIDTELKRLDRRRKREYNKKKIYQMV